MALHTHHGMTGAPHVGPTPKQLVEAREAARRTRERADQVHEAQTAAERRAQQAGSRESQREHEQRLLIVRAQIELWGVVKRDRELTDAEMVAIDRRMQLIEERERVADAVKVVRAGASQMIAAVGVLEEATQSEDAEVRRDAASGLGGLKAFWRRLTGLLQRPRATGKPASQVTKGA